MQAVRTIRQKSELIGEKRGMQTERIRLAKTMLSKGLDLKLICDMTGLSEGQLNELR